MNSYPASCDFMVARPPTYNENMEHFSRIQNSGNNRPIVTPQNNRYNNKSNQILVVHRDPYYPPHRKNLRKRLCNIL